MLRGKVTLLIMMLGMLIAIPAVALAAELFTSELDTVTPNAVTVEQGGTTNFNIGLTATGAIASTITSANASTATVDTAYSLNNTGAVSGSTPSSAFKFYSSGTGCNPGGNCDVTWDGAPTPYSVEASVSVASTTPVGDYALVLSDSANTTDLTNPSVSGGKLSDTTATTITVHVVAPTPSDTTGPDITITTPPDNATYLVNEEVLADYACTDPSGVETCAGPVADGAAINTGSVESKSFTVNAEDTLGNPSTLTHNYTVRRYDFAGFSSPVDNPTVLNTAKAGQAIPLKWRLTDNGSPVTDLAGVTVTAVTRSCTTGVEGTDAIEQYAAGSSGLQNLGDGYYQFNWKSPTSYANSCKTLTINGIGVQQQAYFQFKK